MLILIFICRLLCRVTNRVWKWCGVANPVSPPYTLHKHHDEVRKSALHHGEEPGTRQQSTSIMYIGQSWNRVDATKNSHLLQFVARNWKTIAGESPQTNHTRCNTWVSAFAALHWIFCFFLFFAASLEVLVCSMDKRWQEQQIVILHNASERTYLYEKKFKTLVPLFLTNFRPKRLSLLVSSFLWSINSLRTLLRTAFSFMEIPARNFVSTTVSDLTHSFKYDLTYHAAPWPPWWNSKIPRKTVIFSRLINTNILTKTGVAC